MIDLCGGLPTIIFTWSGYLSPPCCTHKLMLSAIVKMTVRFTTKLQYMSMIYDN